MDLFTKTQILDRVWAQHRAMFVADAAGDETPPGDPPPLPIPPEMPDGPGTPPIPTRAEQKS
jgi:hypothetical protein